METSGRSGEHVSSGAVAVGAAAAYIRPTAAPRQTKLKWSGPSLEVSRLEPYTPAYSPGGLRAAVWGEYCRGARHRGGSRLGRVAKSANSVNQRLAMPGRLRKPKARLKRASWLPFGGD
jgi:hypothetical protein